jgi:hypothetical protein
VPDRAVDVDDGRALPADQVVVVVADPALVPGGAARWLDTADESRRGERVKGVVYGLYGNVADPVPDPGGEGVDPEVVTGADGLQKRDAGGRHPQAGPPQIPCGGRRLR